MRIEALVSFCSILLAQEPAVAPPEFEVASIKPSADAPGSSSGIFESKGRMSAKNVTLKRCIRGAYDVQEPNILGGPKWIGQDRYYIEATTAGPAGDHEMMLMLQTLLTDRFKLTLHREQRVIPGYKLVVRKAGLKAQPSAPGGGSTGSLRRGRMDAAGYSMAQLALKLSEVLHRPVVDNTGVAGRFDFKLGWAPDELQAKPPSSDRGPSIFTALPDQLGLKLESAKVSSEVLVIDSAEKPSEN